MKDLLSPRQVALAIGVSEASLKRWCDKGLLPTSRTAGGHRRLPVEGVIHFLRQTGHGIVRPEVLGLPTATGKGLPTVERAAEILGLAMDKGDEEQVDRVVLDLYLAGHSARDIFDKALAPTFHGLGDRWEHGKVEVYEERRACTLALRVLSHMRRLLPPLPENAPLAVGGTLEGDPYTLPTAMVEIALREAGWRAESLGSGHPVDTLCRAIRKERPRLFWVSVSAFPSPETLAADCDTLYETAVSHDSALVLGGRALSEEIRRQIRYSAYCDTLDHLVSFARTLLPAASRAKPGARAEEAPAEGTTA